MYYFILRIFVYIFYVFTSGPETSHVRVTLVSNFILLMVPLDFPLKNRKLETEMVTLIKKPSPAFLLCVRLLRHLKMASFYRQNLLITLETLYNSNVTLDT